MTTTATMMIYVVVEEKDVQKASITPADGRSLLKNSHTTCRNVTHCTNGTHTTGGAQRPACAAKGAGKLVTLHVCVLSNSKLAEVPAPPPCSRHAELSTAQQHRCPRRPAQPAQPQAQASAQPQPHLLCRPHRRRHHRRRPPRPWPPSVRSWPIQT